MRSKVRNPHERGKRTTPAEREWLLSFGIRLRNRALQLELKGAEVARAAGLEPKTYNTYVNGRSMPTPLVLARIAGALHLTVDELLKSEPVVSDHDPETARALHRFNSIFYELSADQIEFLGDVATVSKSRAFRKRQTQNQNRERSPLARLAIAYEELLPAIIRGYSPLNVETALIQRDDNHDWLQIELLFKRGTDLSKMIDALKKLASERMNASSDDLKVRAAAPEPRGVPLVIDLRLGLTAPPPR
jgi:transcriptional regulator with XRE-family HTH domain